jgi:DNA gyrase/topoisomerase IV subunit B
MEFERGQTMKKLEVIGKAKGTGTLITFKPDAEIFTRDDGVQGGYHRNGSVNWPSSTAV